MREFESLVGLLLAAVLLAAAARRVGAPYPAFLALGGVALAFTPGAPVFTLEPDLALALFVAPILLDAAYDASPRDLKDNWKPLLGLVVVVVMLTTLAVAWIAHTLVPAMPWAAAIALGAVVAPPDAAAATAVLRHVRPPHRILTILEGESLLNDASALLIYRLAVGAVAANSFSFGAVAPTFLLAVAGSLVVGPALGLIFQRLLQRVRDVPSAILIQFIGTFGVWILAEHVGLSAVLTMVCFAMTVARRAPVLTPARIRIPSYAVWETTVFLMNVLAFILIGLQIRPILAALETAERTRYIAVALAVLVTVIVVRIAWVMTYASFYRRHVRRHGFHPPRPMLPPTARGALLISWCGMRGVVTLAAALALPTSLHGREFPFRDLIVLTAFAVVIGTLVIQGLTLRPLLLWLDLHDDDPVGREEQEARARAVKAALASLEGETSPAAEAVRRDYLTVLGGGAARAENALSDALVHGDLHRRALTAARQAVVAMRDSDEIGDDAFHRLEESLDWLEMSGAAVTAAPARRA